METTTSLASRVAIELKEVARVYAESNGSNLSRFVEAAMREKLVRELGQDRRRNRQPAS